MIDIIDAILAIDPTARVSVNGSDQITWHDENPNNIICVLVALNNTI